MTTVQKKLTTEYHEPGRNALCVCGSGIKFKKCCAEGYSFQARKRFEEACDRQDWQNALLYARNFFTWYALSHKAHTVPFLESASKASQDMLSTDIEALGEILDYLHLCYHRLGRGTELQDVTRRVAKTIDDKRWKAKIAYRSALSYLIDRDDPKAAFDTLQSIDIDSCRDPEILALSLQVSPNRLTLTDTLAVIDRILGNTKSESTLLHYSIVKGIQYFLIRQPEDGGRIMEKAIDRFRKLPDERKTSYGLFHFAGALEILGKFSGRLALIEEAEQTARDLLSVADEDIYTSLYFAELHKLRGDCQAGQHRYNEAIDSYSASLERNPSDVTKIFLARAICNAGDTFKSREVLTSIESVNLDQYGKFDLTISWAILAASSLTVDDLEEARNRLKTAEISQPIFVEHRDCWLIELLETKPKEEPGRIRKLIRTLNNYVTLNPNFFGLGIDLNRIISEGESRIPAKPG